MAIESVRKVAVSEGWEPSSDESGEITIHFDSRVDFEVHYAEYPFSDDDITVYIGSYRFVSNPSFGHSEETSGEFQIRPESGLLVLRTDQDRPKPRRIFDSLSEVIDGDTEIDSQFVPERRRVWDFIGRADNCGQIDVIPPFGSEQSVSFEDEVGALKDDPITFEEAFNEYPVKFAELQFDFEGESVSVTYQDDKLVIKTDDERAREYVMQIFETAMLAER